MDVTYRWRIEEYVTRSNTSFAKWSETLCIRIDLGSVAESLLAIRRFPASIASIYSRGSYASLACEICPWVETSVRIPLVYASYRSETVIHPYSSPVAATQTAPHSTSIAPHLSHCMARHDPIRLGPNQVVGFVLPKLGHCV